MIINKSDLQNLYDNNDNNDLCKKLDVSMPTLMKILKENNIKLKGSGNPYYKNKIQVVR